VRRWIALATRVAGGPLSVNDDDKARSSGDAVRGGLGRRDCLRALRGAGAGCRAAARSRLHEILDTARGVVVVVTGHHDYSRP